MRKRGYIYIYFPYNGDYGPNLSLHGSSLNLKLWFKINLTLKVGPALGIISPGAAKKKMRPSILKNNHWKITLHVVSVIKLLIKLLYLIFSNKFCSIDTMVNPFNISYNIIECK